MNRQLKDGLLLLIYTAVLTEVAPQMSITTGIMVSNNVSATRIRKKLKFMYVFVLFLSITLKQLELPSSTTNHHYPE